MAESVSESPLITIVMPAYNAEKYLGEALDSALSQTYEAWQLLAVDDCSSDSTSLILEEYAAWDARIRFFRNPRNQGVSYARNKAMSAADSEWVAFLDSDDVWLPNKLELQMKCAETNDAAFLFTGTQYINSLGEASSYSLIPPERVSFGDLLKQNVISCSSVLVRKSAIEGLSMPGDSMHEDYAMWLDLLKRVGYAYAVQEPLLRHRLHSSSKSSNKFKALKMNINTYRYVGIGPVRSAYSTVCYALRNLSKYKSINAGFEG